MAVAGVVDARVNPNDATQRVVLWGNGRIDTFNTAPVTDGPTDWFTRLDQPVAVAVHVTTWGATTAGYILDKQGGFHTFGGAPNIATSKPVFSDGPNVIVPGVPYWPAGIYKDWAWDPNNAGRGVVLDGFGTLHPFGGAPTPPRTSFRWPILAGRKLKMQWTPDVRAYTLDYAGGVHADYAAATAPGYSRILAAQPAQAGDIPYWKVTDMARDLAITDWVGTPGGYTLDKYGRVHHWGGVEPAIGYQYTAGRDWARVLKVLTADNPLRLLHIGSGGQQREWVASTPPQVVAGGVAPMSPADTVTGTSRPVLSWAYTDAQNDSQAEVPVLVFTEAFATSHTMTDPLVHAASALVYETVVDPNTRGIASPVDLPNGSYRMYVRAKDTAGQWSAWSSRAWAQNVPVPATPTGLTATVNTATFSVTLSVTAATGGVATLVRFDYSDDAGATWAPVYGADAVPLTATTTASDRFPPQGKSRSYRAVAYSIDPRTASAPSATATATLSTAKYLLHALDSSALGGEIGVQGPFEWDRESVVGVFQGLGAKYPTLVYDSEPKARRGSLKVISESRTEWERVSGLAESRSTLVLRDPFGDVVFCGMVGNWPQRLLEATGRVDDATPLRFMHGTELPLVEVRPPHLDA